MPATRTLFQSDSVVLGVSRCGLVDPRPGDEEIDNSFTVILPSCGMFVRHVEGEAVVATPAVALFANADEVSRTSHPHGGEDESLFLSISTDLIWPYLDEFGFTRRSVPLSPVTALAAGVMARRTGHGEGVSTLEVEELAIETVAAILGKTRFSSEPSPGQRRAARLAEEYLSVHFVHDASLKTVAREVGLSPHHLSRVFSLVNGVSLSGYRTRLRLRSALVRLLEGAENIARVATESGFYDHAHLSRHMTRATGLTAGQVREAGSKVGARIPLGRSASADVTRS
jgi:AraC-like DNA-binding protein